MARGNIKTSERQYVAISWYEKDVWTHKPRYQVIVVGDKGETKEQVEWQALENEATSYSQTRQTLLKNLFVVSLSACKKAYRQAYNAWLLETPDHFDPENHHATCQHCGRDFIEFGRKDLCPMCR